MATGPAVLAARLIPLALLSPGPLAQLVAGLVVACAGAGVVNATLRREAVASVPPSDAGAGSGINDTSRYVGAAEGVAVITVLALGPGGLLAGWNVATPPVIGLSLADAAAVLILQNADTRRRVATEEPA